MRIVRREVAEDGDPLEDDETVRRVLVEQVFGVFRLWIGRVE